MSLAISMAPIEGDARANCSTMRIAAHRMWALFARIFGFIAIAIAVRSKCCISICELSDCTSILNNAIDTN
jgi:hypothetical protein